MRKEERDAIVEDILDVNQEILMAIATDNKKLVDKNRLQLNELIKKYLELDGKVQ